MLEIVQSIISFITNLLSEFFSNTLGSFHTIINQFVTNIGIRQDIKSFMGAAISNLLPIPAYIACISVCAPVWATNLIVKGILRIKSFIPGMGGN